MRRVIVLGSTGSIGTAALDVIRALPERLRVVALACRDVASATAFFAPRGLGGFLYWYALYPFHHF